MDTIIHREKIALDLLKQTENTKTIFIVTGISASGKTSLCEILSNKLRPFISPTILTLDDYKSYQYNNYGFIDEEERLILWNTCKYAFQSDIIKKMRKGKTLILDYCFDSSWNKFFESISNKYGYRRIVINCNTRDFDDIWKARVKRDSNPRLREISLTAKAYIRGKLYENNDKLSEEHKKLKFKEYVSNKYNKIHGDYIISDEILLNALNR